METLQQQLAHKYLMDLALWVVERTLQECGGSGARKDPRAVLALALARGAALCNHRALASAASASAKEATAAAAAMHHLRQERPTCADSREDVSRASRAAALASRTTLGNYVDPRVVVAFCRRHGVPVEEGLGGAALARRFAWAVRAASASFRWGTA